MPTNETPRPVRPGARVEHEADASGRDRETRRELAKLTATFVNGLAMAIFAVGGLAPLVALVSGQLVVPDGGWVAGLCSAAFLLSLVVHLFARYVLRREFRR